VTIVAGMLLIAFWRLSFVAPTMLGTSDPVSRP